MNDHKARTNDIIDRLFRVVEKSTNGRLNASYNDIGPESIRRLGMDSLGMLNFLTGVEDEFGIEWEDDVLKETLGSFTAMAVFIMEELGLAA